MLTVTGGRAAPFNVLKAQGRVLLALMLRDIRTRFLGHGLGYLIFIAWPLTHIAVLLGISKALGRNAPYGDDPTIFFATGVLPYIVFSYMSRYIVFSALHNMPLLSFPAVKIMDIFFARAILELLAASLTVLVCISALWGLGIHMVPRQPLQAAYALGATALMGLGFGICNAVIALGVKGWTIVYTLFIIILYTTSGVMFVPDRMPAAVQKILFFNPLLHCVEWLRSSFYDGYGAALLDKRYPIACGMIALFCGLALERLVRGRLLQR